MEVPISVIKKRKEELDKGVTATAFIGSLVALNDKINSLRVKIAIPLESSDARQVGLSGLQRKITGDGMWLNILNNLFFLTNNNFQTLPEMVGMNEKPKEEILYYLDFTLKEYLQTSTCFKIESMFYNILFALDTTMKNARGFENIVNKLFEKITLDNKEFKIRTLLCHSFIRNTYHNNGIHQNRNFTHKVNGVTYEFIKGKEIMCATHMNSVNLLNSIVDDLDEVLASKEIAVIPDGIVDVYAATIIPYYS